MINLRMYRNIFMYIKSRVLMSIYIIQYMLIIFPYLVHFIFMKILFIIQSQLL